MIHGCFANIRARMRKRKLIRKLWRLRRRVEDMDSEFSVVCHCCLYNHKSLRNSKLKRIIQHILFTLSYDELKHFFLVIQSQGSVVKGCFNCPLEEHFIQGRSFFPYMLVLRLWRWPEMRQDDWIDVKPIPFLCSCRTTTVSENLPIFLCCNPFHYAIWPSHDRELVCAAQSEVVHSLSSNDISNTSGYVCECNDSSSFLPEKIQESTLLDQEHEGIDPLPWCHVAYWKNDVRCGALLPVTDSWCAVYVDLVEDATVPSIKILESDPHLTTPNLLAAEKSNHSKGSLKICNTKIAQGFVIFRTSSEPLHDADATVLPWFYVWLYNRSKCTLFVRSSFLYGANHSLIKLPMDHCILIYQWNDGDNLKKMPRLMDNSVVQALSEITGPLTPPLALISFAKGWGITYKRPVITSCPNWVEVIFKK